MKLIDFINDSCVLGSVAISDHTNSVNSELQDLDNFILLPDPRSAGYYALGFNIESESKTSLIIVNDSRDVLHILPALTESHYRKKSVTVLYLDDNQSCQNSEDYPSDTFSNIFTLDNTKDTSLIRSISFCIQYAALVAKSNVLIHVKSLDLNQLINEITSYKKSLPMVKKIDKSEMVKLLQSNIIITPKINNALNSNSESITNDLSIECDLYEIPYNSKSRKFNKFLLSAIKTNNEDKLLSLHVTLSETLQNNRQSNCCLLQDSDNVQDVAIFEQQENIYFVDSKDNMYFQSLISSIPAKTNTMLINNPTLQSHQASIVCYEKICKIIDIDSVKPLIYNGLLDVYELLHALLFSNYHQRLIKMFSDDNHFSHLSTSIGFAYAKQVNLLSLIHINDFYRNINSLGLRDLSSNIKFVVINLNDDEHQKSNLHAKIKAWLNDLNYSYSDFEELTISRASKFINLPNVTFV